MVGLGSLNFLMPTLGDGQDLLAGGAGVAGSLRLIKAIRDAKVPFLSEQTDSTIAGLTGYVIWKAGKQFGTGTKLGDRTLGDMISAGGYGVALTAIAGELEKRFPTVFGGSHKSSHTSTHTSSHTGSRADNPYMRVVT